MIGCDWIPEQYPHSGTMGAAGFLKLLGRPQLDPLTVLVRETAQNSWDARDSAAGPVSFSVSASTLDESEKQTLRRNVFRHAGRALGTSLAEVLSSDILHALYVTDRHTVGLGGPVSASMAEETGVYDWVDFVLNVGKANVQGGHTGGTYGFGKTIAYVVSNANSIVVYSRALYRGEIVSRLMACAIGAEFEENQNLFTGRHWWGVDSLNAPTPVTSADADELAAAIGMPMFDGHDLGTTVMIIDPDFGGRTARQAMNFLSEAVLWNLWPKLVERGGVTPMLIEIWLNGESIPLANPEDRPPLGGFVQAFRELVEIEDDGDEPPGYVHEVVSRLRPKMDVGDLATVPMVFQPRVIVDDGHEPGDSDSPLSAGYRFPDGCRHVALLRSPELVVEYLEGPPSPESSMEWAGVFLTKPSVDSIFAQAEPPTHDTWRPDLISDRGEKSIVKKALQDIRAALENRWGVRASEAHSPATSTAVIAERLSHIVGVSRGSGLGQNSVSRGTGTGRAGGSSPRPHIELLGSGPHVTSGLVETRADFRITPQVGKPRTELRIKIGAAIDGSLMDSDLDIELRLARAEIESRVIELDSDSATILLDGIDPVDVRIFVNRSASTTVLFDVQVEPAAQS